MNHSQPDTPILDQVEGRTKEDAKSILDEYYLHLALEAAPAEMEITEEDKKDINFINRLAKSSHNKAVRAYREALVSAFKGKATMQDIMDATPKGRATVQKAVEDSIEVQAEITHKAKRRIE